MTTMLAKPAPNATRSRGRPAQLPHPAARPGAGQAQPDQDLAHARGADRRDRCSRSSSCCCSPTSSAARSAAAPARLPAVPAARPARPEHRDGRVALGQNLNADIEKGVFDRFRSLPIARSAPLVGAVFADVVRYLILCVMFARIRLRRSGFRIDDEPGCRRSPRSRSRSASRCASAGSRSSSA